MKREQNSYIIKDLSEKYVFLAGPRQTGKTTLAKSLFKDKEYQYLNFDRAEDRLIMTKGEWTREKKLVILDEFHKFPKWKTFVKGYYDTEGLPPSILVTGSVKLNIFKKGSDSMAGRYYYHRLLPLSVKELESVCQPQEALDALLQYSNFPEPFFKASVKSRKRWQNQLLERVIREDLQDLSAVKNLSKILLLVDLLRERVGKNIAYASLARDLEVSPQIVKDWIDLLEQLYVVFRVTPYHRNVARSLLKEPKIYFFDCTMGFNPDDHLENLVAVSLLKELWFKQDIEGIQGELYYLRTKEGKEIDFLTVEDKKIKSLVEVKKSDDKVSNSFKHFLKFIDPDQCFQIVHQLRQPKMVNGVVVKSIFEFLASLKA